MPPQAAAALTFSLMALQDELRQALEENQSMTLALRHFEKLQARLLGSYVELEELEDELQNNYQFIQQLENFTLRGLFLKVLGDEEEQLAQERQAYLEKVLHYRDLKKSIELMEFEEEVLGQKVALADQVRLKLNALIKTRESSLMRTDPGARTRIQRIYDHIDRRERQKAQIQQIINLGYQLTTKLDRMVEYLSGTRNWGKWSKLFSRGNPTNIDRAQEVFYQAKQLVFQLEEALDEYNDKRTAGNSYTLSLSRELARLYFESLISDWVIQGKIRNALSHVRSIRDRAQLIILSLKRERKGLDREIRALDEEKRALVIELN